MVKDIIRDEKILTVPCEIATADDTELVTDLVDTLESLEDIACICANQIGTSKQIIAFYGDDEQTHIMLNPVMKRALYPIRTVEECISIDGESKVTRFGKINVEYDEIVDGKLVSRKKDFQANEAQAIQHAIDHCKGKLI